MSESRFAIIISVVALAVTSFQARSAYEANAFNKEQITIEALATDSPGKRTGSVNCFGLDLTTIVLNWRVTIFNNSTQPITIKELQSISTSPAGPLVPMYVSVTEPVDREFPVLIDARSFKTFEVALPTLVSPEFVRWFGGNGGCTGKPIWPSPKTAQLFDETGWKQQGGSGAMFTIVTGGGENFFHQAVWR